MFEDEASGCSENAQNCKSWKNPVDPAAYHKHYKSSCLTYGGVGFGLRHQHFQDFRTALSAGSINKNINWLEVHPENYLTLGSSFEILEELSNNFQLSYHGVGLSLGSPWDEESAKHLNRIKNLMHHLPCDSFSEHISWSKHEMRHSHDLLPILYNDDSLQLITDNINRVQDAFKMQIAVENPSIYVELPHKYSESEFIDKILNKTGCALLLDINNIEVCAFNLGFEMQDYLSTIDLSKVREIHIAGHTERPVANQITKIDTHSRCASEDVWVQLKGVLQDARFNGFVMYEWDDDLPKFDEFMAEIKTLVNMYSGIHSINGNVATKHLSQGV